MDDNRTDKNQLKHLEFIQSVVTRMNANSFQSKGWAITIFSALLAIYAGSGGNRLFLVVSVAPALLFWFLDAYYLQQERKFRGVYNDAAGLSKEETRIKIRLFEMPIQHYTKGKYSYWSVFFSRTIFPLYALMIGLVVLGSIFL